MADFTTALYGAFRRFYGRADPIRTPMSQQRGIRARMSALERQYGKGAGLTAATGIPARTWRDWKSGKHAPSAKSLGRIAGAYDSLITGGRAPVGMTIEAIVAALDAHDRQDKRKKSLRYNSNDDQKYRKFRAQNLTLTQLQHIAQAFVAGARPPALAQLTLDAIAQAYSTRFDFEGNEVTVEVW